VRTADRPRTDVDPPRVELPSVGAYRFADLGAIPCWANKLMLMIHLLTSAKKKLPSSQISFTRPCTDSHPASGLTPRAVTRAVVELESYDGFVPLHSCDPPVRPSVCFMPLPQNGAFWSAIQRGRPRTAWVDNITARTGLPVEESIRMTEDRDTWRKYVHGVANPRIEDG